MNHLKCLVAILILTALSACGGGGGGAGTNTGGAVVPPPVVAPAASSTLTVGLSGGGTSVSASGSTVQAVVKDATGVLVTGKLVTFTGDSKLVKFSPPSGQVLTDAAGVASIQVSPASISAVGAGTLEAQTKVGASALLTAFDFQLSASNLGLQSLSLGSGALSAFGNRPVSVLATINGVVTTNTPVQVTFTSSCGTVEPATVTTDASGRANTTYTASLATCAGTNVTISAASVGATSVSGTLAVASSIATNVRFISATPALIYLDGSVGATQSQVIFKVVDSNGNPLQNKKLRLSLSNTATGVSLNTVGNNLPVDLTTDSLGQLSAAVFSGTVPTSLNVRAVLLDASDAPTLVTSNSNLLTVAVGRPVQRSLSLSLGKFSIEGGSIDGVTADVTLSMADRQGNPVPAGTQVNFVSETGVMLPPVCTVVSVAEKPDASSCTVTIRSQGSRTLNGRVSILAYVAGEEDFVDINGNNVFDSGDTFTDLGRAFRDDNGASAAGVNGTYDAGEFQVPRAGAAACSQAAGCPGDGVWGAAEVRAQATVVFATSAATILGTFQLPLASGATVGLDIRVSDLNSNSIPTGSTIVAKAIDRTTAVGNACVISSTSSVAVTNRLGPIDVAFGFAGCIPGDLINISVTTPSGFVTLADFPIPTPPAP